MHSACQSREQFSKKTMFHLSKLHSLNNCPKSIITTIKATIDIKGNSQSTNYSVGNEIMHGKKIGMLFSAQLPSFSQLLRKFNLDKLSL